MGNKVVLYNGKVATTGGYSNVRSDLILENGKVYKGVPNYIVESQYGVLEAGTPIRLLNGQDCVVTYVYDDYSFCDIKTQGGMFKKVPSISLVQGYPFFPSHGLYPIAYSDIPSEQVVGLFGFAYKIVKKISDDLNWIQWNVGYNEIVASSTLTSLRVPKCFQLLYLGGTYKLRYRDVDVLDFRYDINSGVFLITGKCSICGEPMQVKTHQLHPATLCNCTLGGDLLGVPTKCVKVSSGQFKVKYEDGAILTLKKKDYGKNPKTYKYVHPGLSVNRRSKKVTYNDMHVIAMEFDRRRGKYVLTVKGTSGKCMLYVLE